MEEYSFSIDGVHPRRSILKANYTKGYASSVVGVHLKGSATL